MENTSKKNKLMKLSFEVSESQFEKVLKWQKKLIKKHPHLFKKDENRYPNFNYIFSPTGIGTGLVVKETHTGETIDLTDYKEW